MLECHIYKGELKEKRGWAEIMEGLGFMANELNSIYRGKPLNGFQSGLTKSEKIEV